MIDREQWAHIYDWARYNGLSPLDFIVQAQKVKPFSSVEEEAMYDSCRQLSISRTQYPTK